MKKIISFLIFLLSFSVFSQDKLSLEECYSLLYKNYPLVQQNDLLEKQNVIDLEVIKTGKLPSLDFLAQATYQSDVTKIPIAIPNNPVEPPNKDQYKVNVSINQLIYNGGLIEASASVKKADLKTHQQQIEVNLYQLKSSVNQLYFSILLNQDKGALLSAKKNLLDVKLKEVKSGIKYGMLLPTSDKIIEAELLKIQQQFNEINVSTKNLTSTLSLLVGIEINSNTQLQTPEITTNLTTDIQRPEIELFQLQKEQVEAYKQVISKKDNPKLIGFATGGYGNPGLNMLDNSFQTYYLAGIKLNWNVFDWNSSKKEQNSLQINNDIIDNQQQLFKLNTSIELEQQLSEIEKLSSNIKEDEKIIELRKQILAAADSQLKNGVITSSAYITELTNLYEAENNLNKNKIQLLLAKINYKTINGN
ncbi:MAG: TolC family protein [Flavobacteriaceae bacterium]|nr:TolC family protein [Flavobacteriaceae bacterium]